MPDGETPQVNIGTCSKAGLERTADTEEQDTSRGDGDGNFFDND